MGAASRDVCSGALAAVLLATCLLVAPRVARANMSKSYVDGDRSSVLLPGGPTTVRVDREELSFVLPRLSTAFVTASYTLTNAGATAETDDVAFAFVPSEERPAGGADAHASIEVDGVRVSFRTAEDPDARRWSTLPYQASGSAPAGVGLLLFSLDFAPGQTRAVTVRYEQQANELDGSSVNGTFTFDYLLSPARHWAAFGPLDVSVRVVPANVRLSSSLPLRRDGDTYRAHLAGLPDGELHFETTSLDGTWFGMTGSDGYVAILLAAVVLAALGSGAGVGRSWFLAMGWTRVLLPVVIGGPAAAACALAVFALAGAAFPGHALGVGYERAVLSVPVVLLALPIGAVVSAVAASRRRRARRSREANRQDAGNAR